MCCSTTIRVTYLIRDGEQTLHSGHFLQVISGGHHRRPSSFGRLPPAATSAAWRQVRRDRVSVNGREEPRLGRLRRSLGGVVLEQTEDVSRVDDGIDAAYLEFVAEPVVDGRHRRQHGRRVERDAATHQPHSLRPSRVCSDARHRV